MNGNQNYGGNNFEFDLVNSRADSMAAMTVRTLETNDERNRSTIHSKMKGKRARKL